MSKITYANIPGVAKPVSRIFFGTGGNDFLNGKNQNDLLDSIFALGINTLDTARQYGLSENVIGDWLEARGRRDDVVILSKCGHHNLEDGTKRVNAAGIKEDLALSLESLKTDYIDMYILHRDDPDVAVDELVETFNELNAAGKIGAFGGSNWTPARLDEANEYAYKHNLIPFVISSPNFSLADPMVDDIWGGGSLSIAGTANTADRNWHKKTQIATVTHSSLGRGFFSGKVKSSDYEIADQLLDGFAMKSFHSAENFERLHRCEILAEKKHATVSQIALSWIFHQGLNLFSVVSTSSVARMQTNIDALNLDLTEAECLYLNLEA